MREIKFKAWDKERKRFLKPIETAQLVIRPISGRITDGAIDVSEKIELLQYTGLKDKNGVEIYEGDIVQYFRNELAVIVFQSGGVDVRSLSWRECEPLQRRMGSMKVVGSIYENPELLEVDQ